MLGLTLTTLVAEYGSLALVLRDFPQDAPRLAPGSNVISQAMVRLYLSGWFMTVAALVNAASVLLLLVAAARESRETAPQRGAVRETAIPGLPGRNPKFQRNPGGLSVTGPPLRASELFEANYSGNSKALENL